ncbi:MAG TPA: hypothetical protein VFF80_05250, partial [Bacillota bacterium]|nr:hypothetical protein [Bacillota bacterium]
LLPTTTDQVKIKLIHFIPKVVTQHVTIAQDISFVAIGEGIDIANLDRAMPCRLCVKVVLIVSVIR